MLLEKDALWPEQRKDKTQKLEALPAMPNAGKDADFERGPQLNSLLKYPTERRVGACGLHDFLGNHGPCRPGALTGRLFQQAVERRIEL